MNAEVYKAKEILAQRIADVLEKTLRDECGIFMNEQQRTKLFDLIRFELTL